MIENLHQVVEVIEKDWKKLQVLVVGDVMLDKYIWGHVERISPEAPVPVVRAEHQSEQPGGAANVAMNLSGLGAAVTLSGFAGMDADQAKLEELLRAGLVMPALTGTKGIPTNSKLRILGGNQQMLRLDRESDEPRSAECYALLLAGIEEALPHADAVILSDYAKGVLTEEVCQRVIARSNALGVPVLVDPKAVSFARYRGATTICPNLAELARAAGESPKDLNKLFARARWMVVELGLEYMAVTMSEKGIAVVRADSQSITPAVAREVFDVSGAGDTVIATLALAIASRLDIETAVELANLAAGVVVGKVGTVPIQGYELLAAISPEIALSMEAKILTLDRLCTRVAGWRAAGQSIVLTNGCFDLLHVGHITLLEQARRQGDRLVLAVNSDCSVSRLKGPSRPMVCQADRAQVLAALTAVDAVVIFDESTPIRIIEALRPDVLVKGGDYTEETVVGAREVKSWGGRVKLIPIVEGFSTTMLIAKATARA